MLPVSAPKRPKMLNVRLSDVEYGILAAEAQRMNATVTQVVRSRCFGERLDDTVDRLERLVRLHAETITGHRAGATRQYECSLCDSINVLAKASATIPA